MNNNLYIVKPNDNLYDIAIKHNTTVGILKALNNLSSNFLQIGQILKIPSSLVEKDEPGDYIIYTIQKGDNLYNIAKKYQISLEDLINYNEQGSTLLQIGQTLFIPIKNSNINNDSNINYVNYVIKPGDTLYNIAKRYQTSVDEIKRINKFQENLLKIGDIILLPNTTNYKTYVVRTNDTLRDIANRFNLDIDTLKSVNNLETEDLIIGQILLIPKNISYLK